METSALITPETLVSADRTRVTQLTPHVIPDTASDILASEDFAAPRLPATGGLDAASGWAASCLEQPLPSANAATPIIARFLNRLIIGYR